MLKKVAIIGAGPAGLVTAKTLLHHYPHHHFAPAVFEARHSVGGLWNVSSPDEPAFVDRDMRTNLSRFTVGFSDFSWELNCSPPSGGDLFPRAVQVNEYLEKYRERYIPDSVLRLGCRVVRAQRRAGGWTVQWRDQKHAAREGPQSEDFDYLVVASGYFSKPNTPHIPGLENCPPERVIHSSATASAQRKLLDALPQNSKLLVVGGSMSGAETASSLALTLASSSSSSSSSSSTATATPKNIQIHHLTTRPFWALPTYLPDPSGSFLPLDLVMYDLSRRPPGEIQYALGPVPPQRAAFVHKYFASMLGTDQQGRHRPGANGAAAADDDGDILNRPPWIAVTDHYAEFVRAGDIELSLGRLEKIVWPDGADRGTVQVREGNNHDAETTTSSITDVAGIVLATGFTPYSALEFLSSDVLAALGYWTQDPVFPLVLDDKATFNPAVPDLGFVGMYRGPYWGVMEMQARSLAQRWAGSSDESHNDNPSQVVNLQTDKLRSPSVSKSLAQFPMGDYVGLMETFARELGIKRSSLVPAGEEKQEEEEGEGETRQDERSGPVVAARYSVPTDTNKADIEATRSALSGLLRPLFPAGEGRQQALSHAIFRALHGSWRVEQQQEASGSTTLSGSATFRPRAVAPAGVEYVYSEEISGRNVVETVVSISSSNNRITLAGPMSRHYIQFVAVDKDGDAAAEYRFRHVAKGVFLDETEETRSRRLEYLFVVRGVQVVSWQETTIDLVSGAKQVKTYTRVDQ